MCQLPKFEDERLLVGTESSDDAGVYLINDDLAMIQTVDMFPPVVDDPYTFGEIAATNALSDVYAMGGQPKLAMNILCYPEDLSKDVLQAILTGGAHKVQEAGGLVIGGHTIRDEEPKYGLSVTGFVHPKKVLTNNNAKPGDVLILTKPIGTGALNLAVKHDLIKPTSMDEAIKYMTMLNKKACEIISSEDFDIHACTDVTGFGLLGHGYEMALGSGVTLMINGDSVPLLPEAKDMAAMGVLPAGAYMNRDYVKCSVMAEDYIEESLLDIMYDPQTSGGLLIAVNPKDAPKLLQRLQDELPVSEIIGVIDEKKEKYIHVV